MKISPQQAQTIKEINSRKAPKIFLGYFFTSKSCCGEVEGLFY